MISFHSYLAIISAFCMINQVFTQKQPPLVAGKPVQPLPTTNCPGACTLSQILCPSRRIQCVVPSSCYQIVSNGKEMMYVLKKSVNSALPVVATGNKQTAELYSKCVDHNSNCRPFMELCKDKLYYMFLATYCPKSCGLCQSPLITTTPPSQLVVQPPVFSMFSSSPAPLPVIRTAKHVLESKKRAMRKWPVPTSTSSPAFSLACITQGATKKKWIKRKKVVNTTTASSTSTTTVPPTTSSQSADSQEEETSEEPITQSSPPSSSPPKEVDVVVKEEKQSESVEISNFLAIKNRSSSDSWEGEEYKRQKKEVSSSTVEPLVEIFSSINVISMVEGSKLTTSSSLKPANPVGLVRPKAVVEEGSRPKRCRDQSPNCKQFATNCRDNAFVEMMSLFCKKTCKLC